MKEQSASGILGTSIEKIKDLVDVSTIIGEPIKISETLQIIPVSKVTYGFASGGTDFPSKSNQELFGGGGGAGITISPVAFLVVNNGSVSVKYINAAEGSVERVIGMVPDIVDKATDVISQLKNKDNTVDNAINDYMNSAEPTA
ncbi:MAG: sporulation protein YtfJ [Clostridia bacterium]|nr:sporulation protein YtfJ [Clostridia bacterium]MBQ3006843.1 sporulation protein YtfJ [Clostridia bacterium]